MRPPQAIGTGLPEGVLWRRAEIQLVTRLGVFPGDHVVLMGPPGLDIGPTVAKRLPRVRFMQLAGPGASPFSWSATPAPGVARVRADPYRPPIGTEGVDAVVVLFGFPLLDQAAHRRLVATWAPRLAPFGKWYGLVALDGPRDDRLKAGERDLKEIGFEKVRSMRLALGRMGQALYLVTGRWPGLGDDEGDGDDADDGDDDDE